MPTRIRCLAAVVLLIGSASVRAEVKDAVELLPAQTLACIEIRQPARLAREVAALVKGSALDDLPRLLAKLQAQEGPNRDYRSYAQRAQLTAMSMFFCPEAIDESGRIRGGFIALTGFAKDNTPEVVGVLQTGTSNLPGIVVRAFTTSYSVHMVGEVEGVPLYREKSYSYISRPVAPGQPGVPPQRQERESGPFVAHLPGLILFGSSVDSLKDVIRRAKGKRAGASLVNLRAFKDSAALRERPGLFAYVDAAGLQAKLDEQIERKDNSPRFLTGLQTILGKQAMQKVLFSLTLHNGTLEGQLRFDFNDKSASPLLGLLPDRAAQRELLHFAPENALLALTGGLGEGEKRWKTFTNLLDAFYKLDGGGGDNRPSVAIRELEKKLKLHIDKDVLAQVSGAGVVVYKDWQHKPNSWTLLLRATDADAAAKLEKTGLPSLFSLGNEEVLTPQEEEVQGQRIKTLRDKAGAKRLPFPVHYGRRGAVLVLGADRARVAEALVMGGKKAGLLTETKVAAALKEIDDKTAAIGVLSSQALLDLFAELNRRPVIMRKPAAPGLPPPPQPDNRLAEKAVEPSKAMQALHKAAEPLVFTLQRKSDSVVLELRPLPLRRMTPRLLDVWVETLLKPGANTAPFGAVPNDAPTPRGLPKPDRKK